MTPFKIDMRDTSNYSDESSTPLKINRDFYYDELGRFVLTEAYLKQRGTCCENGCRHCPYGFKKNDKDALPTHG